jgi:DNA primase
MADHEMDNPLPLGETGAELRNLLNRMLVERIKTQQTGVIAASKADPSSLALYRELQARRLQLEAALAQAD